MADAKSGDDEVRRAFSKTILSASFTLLGLTVGFYGVITANIATSTFEPGLEVVLILSMLSVVILLDCALGILAILGVAGYYYSRRIFTVLTSLMLGLVGIFVLVMSIQLLT